MADSTAIGIRVHSARLRAGLSQRALATDGVSFACISRIEAGTRTPSTKALRKLAPRLGVSVHWLETGEEDPAAELARLVLDGQADGRKARALAKAIVVATNDGGRRGGVRRARDARRRS